MLPINRRSFTLSLFVAQLACLGCGGGNVSFNPKVGEERTQKIERLQKQADLKRSTGAKKAPGR
jgi:hypothetical protein